MHDEQNQQSITHLYRRYHWYGTQPTDRLHWTPLDFNHLVDNVPEFKLILRRLTPISSTLPIDSSDMSPDAMEAVGESYFRPI